MSMAQTPFAVRSSRTVNVGYFENWQRVSADITQKYLAARYPRDGLRG